MEGGGGEEVSIEELASNLSIYKDQLHQVRQLLNDAQSANSEYVDMERELTEVIALTEELLATARQNEMSAPNATTTPCLSIHKESEVVMSSSSLLAPPQLRFAARGSGSLLCRCFSANCRCSMRMKKPRSDGAGKSSTYSKRKESEDVSLNSNPPPGKNIIVLPKRNVIENKPPKSKRKKENENATPNHHPNSKKRYVSPYFDHPRGEHIIVLPKGNETNMVVYRKPRKLRPELCIDAYRRKAAFDTWEPPSSPGFRLLQHDHAWDPWRVLVICMLLNKTNGGQVKPILEQLFNLCPDAETCTKVATEEIEHVIRTLGLQHKRAESIKYLSEDYLKDSWTHVTQLYGVGKYAGDAHALFCTGDWKNVTPKDKELVRYWTFLWEIEHILSKTSDESDEGF